MDIRAGYDGCWLQDYVPKVRADVVEIKELAPASDREGMAPTLTQSEAEPRPLDASGDGALQHGGRYTGTFTPRLPCSASSSLSNAKSYGARGQPKASRSSTSAGYS